MKVALLQTAPVLGDLTANLAHLNQLVAEAAEHGAQLCVTPELATTGYFLTPDQVPHIPADHPELERLGTHGPAVIVGFAETPPEGEREDRRVYNTAAVVHRGGVQVVQRKNRLVTMSGEPELFARWEGEQIPHSGDVDGVRVSVLICNDAWSDTYRGRVISDGDPELLIVLVASIEDHEEGVSYARHWDAVVNSPALLNQCGVVMVNCAGEELGRSGDRIEKFWGGSRIVGSDGESIARMGSSPGVKYAVFDVDAVRRLRRNGRRHDVLMPSEERRLRFRVLTR